MVAMDRFWSKVAGVEDGCWLWQGTLDRSGYGKFKAGGRYVGAHRVAYALTTGIDPGTLYVCHRCDVRACVRPDHLFLGDHAANMEDAIAKGRIERRPILPFAPSLRSQPGEAHGRAILTEREVVEMRELHADYGMTYAALAAWYGVAAATAKAICRGRRWRHVPEAPRRPAV
jgi:hypothetical protein